MLPLTNGQMKNGRVKTEKLGSDPKSSATDELVVFGVHDAAGDVAVEDIESQVEGFGAETEGEVDLNEEVNEAWAHVPPNFRLLIH